MTTYLILIPGDEDAWDARPETEQQAVYDVHSRFQALLAERGHTIVATKELAHSKEATIVRSDSGGLRVTQGPYAETTEQICGFYLVDSDDLDDLVEVCRVLAPVEAALEIRAAL